MSQRENPELTFEGSISYPIVWEPWNDPCTDQSEYLVPPYSGGNSFINWQPADGSQIYRPIPANSFTASKIRNASNSYIGYKFPESLGLPVGRPGKSVIEMTVHFKKSNGQSTVNDSVCEADINAPGIGYAVDDIIYVEPAGGDTDAIFIVTNVNTAGGLTAIELIQPGYGFSISAGEPVRNIESSGGGATIDILDIEEYPISKNHQWALIQGEEVFPLRKDYEDDEGVYFWPKEINLEKYDTQFNPNIAWLRGQNTESTGTGAVLVNREFPWNYQWYLLVARFSSLVITYKVTYLPIGSLENGDIQDVPINMASITKMLNTRDRRRDKKKGRDVTPVRELLRKASGDLRRRREINRPLTNAF